MKTGRMRSLPFRFRLAMLGSVSECQATATYLEHQGCISLDRVVAQLGEGLRVNITPLLGHDEKLAVSDYIQRLHELEDLKTEATAA